MDLPLDNVKARERLFLLAGLMVFLTVLIRTAWVCDDAYISFRTVDNFVNGYGLRWNIDERVWSFTNPLWVLVFSAVYGITREAYFTSIFFSIALAIGAVALVARGLSRSVAMMALTFVIFIFSKAFVDYSTSGLENSLGHLLLAVFLLLFLKGEMSYRQLFWLALVGSLATLNRMDAVLLVAPPLFWAWWGLRGWRATRTVLLGFTPLILWEIFAVIYYGFPLPNTYFAKTHTGIPSAELIQQGLLYFLDSIQRDPITLTAIFLGIAAAVATRNRKGLAVTAGILLFFVYTVKVGGDFMSGRFFTAPLLSGVALLTMCPWPERGWGVVAPAAIAITLGFTSPRVPILSDETYGTTGEGGINPKGIADERGWYYQGTGLLTAKRGVVLPDHEWTHKGLEARYRGEQRIYDGCVGFMGFFAGPKIHIVDMFSLTQPLLSHLPIEDVKGWRIGHFSRMYPAGFDKTGDPCANTIIDSGMHVYYDKLCILTRGSLWSWSRLGEIIKFNAGAYGSLVNQYTHPQPTLVAYADVSQPKAANTPWDAEGTYRLNEAGIQITLADTSHAPRIEWSVDHNDHYLAVFRLQGAEVGYISLERKFIEHGGLRIDTLTVPTETYLRGYDRIDVRGFFGDGMYALGHLRLLD